MAETLLKVQSVSKKYCRDLRRSLGYGLFDLGREVLGQPTGENLRPKEFWALSDISFNLKRGQCLGMIGGNGAGKSTLLKIISGLVKPTRGKVTVRGRLQALIELGAGFHPVLTGRENIFINAAILGIPSYKVESKLDEIIDFAEIGDFIDAPVQSYSSGMRVRLGFSVALHMDPDVILIDEVLAVGDANFRRKAKLAMDGFLNKGRAVIFVSHNMHQVLGVSDRILWLDKGLLKSIGDPEKIAQQYALSSLDQNSNERSDFNPLFAEKITGEIKLSDIKIKIRDQSVRRCINIPPGPVLFRLNCKYEVSENISAVAQHGFYLRTANGEKVANAILSDSVCVKANSHHIRNFEILLPSIHPGHYSIDYVLNHNGGMMFDGVKDLITINVTNYQKGIEKDNYCYDRMVIGALNGEGAVLMKTKMCDDH